MGEKAVARKQSVAGGPLFFAAVAGVFLSFLNENRELVVVLGGTALALWLVRRALVQDTSTPASPAVRSEEPPIRMVRTDVRPEEPPIRMMRTELRIPGPRAAPPRPSTSNGDLYWLMGGQGKELGDLVYAGTGLVAAHGDGIEPALIDPALPVDQVVRDCTVRRLDYWPSYTGASPQARAGYQAWLRTGRSDPEADLGYVFLYFYGLERRVLHDVKTSVAARAELPAIEMEIERLLGIYTESRSFQDYAGSLLDFLRSSSDRQALYEDAPPPLRRDRDLTFTHRLALAQCAADGKPLPAEWAYLWFRGDPDSVLRTPVRRCAEQFRQLFLLRYREYHGDGMPLPRNKTRLKMQRRAASTTFGSDSAEQTLTFDLPDVSVLRRPITKLQELADACCEQLGPYSRLIGKDPASSNAFDALVELPLALWPEPARLSLQQLRESLVLAGGYRALPFQNLRSALPKWETVNRQKMLGLYSVLSEAGLGMEPDLRFGGDVPASDSTVILFTEDPAPIPAPAANARYMAAVLTLQLGAAVALADGEFTDVERTLLTRQLEEWLHLSEAERRRLRARLQLLLLVPPKLTGLKSRIGALAVKERDEIGNFLAAVALADATVTPEEVKTLEKTFRLLGLDMQSVYSRIHAATTEPVTVRLPSATATGFAIPRAPTSLDDQTIQLDPQKLAMLRADSERVAAILGSIFASDLPGDEPLAAPVEAEQIAAEEPSLMGLNSDYSALTRTLLTRAHWTRAELEELAADRGLMLDGAIERLNEAAFEAFDRPFLEGDDPVDVNQELAREILQ